MNFKITNIKKRYKNSIYKLIEEINKEDDLGYSLTDEWLDYVIENVSEGIFLAFNGEKLAGLATSMINPVYSDQATLNVVVSPEYRNKGLGSILYNKIYEFANMKDVKVVEGFVKKRLTNGVEFAEKRGFNLSMYSWEMELLLDDIDFIFDVGLGLNFRRANKEDELNYKKIIYDAFADELGDYSLMQTLKDSSIIIYILEKENKAIGSVTVQLRKNLSLAYCYDIAILKEYRGQGLGSYLLKSCIKELKEYNIHKVSLLVTGENKRALQLYRKIGFKEIDIDLIMTKMDNFNKLKEIKWIKR